MFIQDAVILLLLLISLVPKVVSCYVEDLEAANCGVESALGFLFIVGSGSRFGKIYP